MDEKAEDERKNVGAVGGREVRGDSDTVRLSNCSGDEVRQMEGRNGRAHRSVEQVRVWRQDPRQKNDLSRFEWLGTLCLSML